MNNIMYSCHLKFRKNNTVKLLYYPLNYKLRDVSFLIVGNRYITIHCYDFCQFNQNSECQICTKIILFKEESKICPKI